MSPKVETGEPKKTMSLTTWILISLAAGIVVGIICSVAVPEGSPVDTYVIEGVFYVCGQWFIRLMQMLVVPLVFCSIVCGAASMSDPKLLGKVGLGTILMYLCTTALAVIIAILLAQLTSPGVGLDMASIVQVEPKATSTDQTMADMLINIVPTNIVAAMNSGAMLQIIFFALILGFILGRLGKKVATVNRFFTQFNAVMMYMIGLILKVAPLGIFCLIARTFANLGLTGILPMVKFIGTVYLGLFVQLLIVYMVILFLFTRLNPFHFLRKMLPVMLFAFSTSSSNATIPLNMETLEKKIGVDEKVASFTIPLGATINMDGTAIMQGAAVIFISQAFGIDLSFTALLTVVITAVTASIGTAGVPGVGTIMLAMVFESVGLPAEGVAMIMGIDRLLDMGRTAINVTGDAVVTTCMAKVSGMLDAGVFRNNDYAAVSEEDLVESETDEPAGIADFTAEGDPTEIGEQGDPDKFTDIEVPHKQK
ncbi:dicarboxylate/amino acid:cation symporter [Denitrobacterium detoxificans]|uniref:dicarboxylate/amino acid:cation symporter n=1 Tax=Denitrobacterium detoxificans TaxID=79604 RepID=UPI0026EAE337|nr:dicarboxylate/amino acid:cation symporter [Denitrobacterium detoxificans]